MAGCSNPYCRSCYPGGPADYEREMALRGKIVSTADDQPRARELLEAELTPEQLEEYRTKSRITLKSRAGDTWVIKASGSRTENLEQNGYSRCFGPANLADGLLPYEDFILGQLIYIRSMTPGVAWV